MLGAAPSSHRQGAWAQLHCAPACSWVPVRVSRKARGKTWNLWRNFQDVADPAGADGRWHPWIVTGLGTACSWAPSSLRRRAAIWALVVAAGTAPCPGVFPARHSGCSRGISVALDTGCPCGAARRALLLQGWEGKGTTPWLAGKKSSQESPHPAQDRLEIPIHSSGSIPARAPRAGQSQKNPGQIQEYKPALSSSWEINPGQDSDPWGTEVQGHLGLN